MVQDIHRYSIFHILPTSTNYHSYITIAALIRLKSKVSGALQEENPGAPEGQAFLWINGRRGKEWDTTWCCHDVF